MKITFLSVTAESYETLSSVKSDLKRFTKMENNTALLGIPNYWWLRIHLPVQETWVQSLVQEDPTCHGVLSTCATTIELVL